MKNLAAIHAFETAPYAYMNLYGGKSAIRRVMEYASSLPDVTSVLLITDSSGSPALLEAAGEVTFAGVTGRPLSAEMLFRILAERGKEFDNIFYFSADTPFLDPRLSEKMYRNHLAYFAEYSFADGYPVGLAPEIIRASMLPALERLSAGNTAVVTRETVFSVLQKDINAFDIETEISPLDLRLLRATLACDTQAGFTLVSRLLEAGATDAESVCDLFVKRPEVLRTVPAYVCVQIVGGCPQTCAYCPFPVFGGDILSNREYMPMKEVERVLDAVHEYSREAVISVSLWGEPSLHPDIHLIVEAVAARKGLSLIIETSGVGWREETIEKIEAIGFSGFSWILSLDAQEKRLYTALRGEGCDEAWQTAGRLSDLFPGRVYLQAVRMTDSEEQLESFYRGLTTQGKKVIIQKYDNFCGFLPQKKVTDLSPITRFPCRHLARDLTVLLDGTVTICREDLGRKHVLGNLFHEPLPVVWERGLPWYHGQIALQYEELCRTCDEYYTYNF